MGQVERKIAQYKNNEKELLDKIFRRWVHEHKCFVQQVSLCTFSVFFLLMCESKISYQIPDWSR